MLQILKNIAIVLLLIIIIDKAFTYAFMNLIFKNTLSGESGGTINYLIKKHDIDFLILGSSRAKHGTDPALITTLGKTGYNVGINGTTVLNSLLILDILMQNNVKIKTVVVSADLTDYARESQQLNLDQMKRVYPYDTPLIREYVGRIGIAEQVRYFFGLYRLNRKILNVAYNFTKKNSIKENTGYAGLPNGKEKLESEPLTKNYVYNNLGTGTEAMMRIKKICDENNIRLIVVFPPSYKNVSLNVIQQKLMVEDFKKRNILNIIDLSNIENSPILAKEENWKDVTHFTYLGSQKFSHILNSEILKIKLLP